MRKQTTRVATAAIALAIVAPQCLWAYSTNRVRAPEPIPQLRPPLDIILPTFWEQYGGSAMLAALVLLVGTGLLIWRLCRPKPRMVTPPEVAAKQALESLRGRTEDLELFAALSQNLRRYTQAVLKLPLEAWTPEELLAAIQREARLSPELLGLLKEILRECEARTFAPIPPAGEAALAVRALKFVAKWEAEASYAQFAANRAPQVSAPPSALSGGADDGPATAGSAPPAP